MYGENLNDYSPSLILCIINLCSGDSGIIFQVFKFCFYGKVHTSVLIINRFL